jgi:hypothetical protein
MVPRRIALIAPNPCAREQKNPVRLTKYLYMDGSIVRKEKKKIERQRRKEKQVKVTERKIQLFINAVNDRESFCAFFWVCKSSNRKPGRY